MQELQRLATGVKSTPSTSSWKRELALAVRDPDELIDRLRLPDALRGPARAAARAFPLVVPPGFLARMRPGDPNDPLLRQVLPLGAELDDVPGFVHDPVADGTATLTPGLIHKYEGRALLIAAGTCAVHCRYCFRRHFPYDSTPRGMDAWQPALDALRASPSIREVILSGGDPLILADDTLAKLVDRLAAIPHVTRLRIHSRLPIVIPERVTPALTRLLRATRLAPWVVVHANHPRELDAACASALTRLVDAGVPVLNQAVLLRGVNDDARVLADLCETLADLRVAPYYLHQLDAVAGAAHFDVPDAEAIALSRELHRLLPGYAAPRLVREVPGAPGKTPVV